jgi:hypothetical protein
MPSAVFVRPGAMARLIDALDWLQAKAAVPTTVASHIRRLAQQAGPGGAASVS